VNAHDPTVFGGPNVNFYEIATYIYRFFVCREGVFRNAKVIPSMSNHIDISIDWRRQQGLAIGRFARQYNIEAKEICYYH
jgi:hypothetical protein